MSHRTHPTDPGEPLEALAPTIDSLWATFAPSGRSAGLRRILFTSTGKGQGTTTVAMCTAIGLARHLQARVTIVEIQSPSVMLAALIGEEPKPGLSEVLAGQVERERGLRRSQGQFLTVMPGGGIEIEPGALNSKVAREVFTWLETDRDFLLIDAPPILRHPEARPLLWHADQAVVVLESGKSRKDEARALTRALGEAGLEVLGAVLNRYKPDLPSWIGGSDLP